MNAGRGQGDWNREDRTQYGRRGERYERSSSDLSEPFERERFSGEEYGRSMHSPQWEDPRGRRGYEDDGFGYREPWSSPERGDSSYGESYRRSSSHESDGYRPAGYETSRTSGAGRWPQENPGWQRQVRGYRESGRSSSTPEWEQDRDYRSKRHEQRSSGYAGGAGEPFGYIGSAGGIGGQYGESSQSGEPSLGRGSFGSGQGAPAGQYSGYAAMMEERRRRGPHAGRGPKNYRRSDERIKEDVSERLSSEGEVDASEIEVEVRSGIVTLTGTVSSRREKRLAEDCCEDISGVKDVSNQLRVQRNEEEEARDRTSSSSKEQRRAGQGGQAASKG